MSSTSLPKVTRSVFSVAVFAAANAFRAYAQSGNGDLQFEVVSIKHSDPKLMGSVWRGDLVRPEFVAYTKGHVKDSAKFSRTASE